MSKYAAILSKSDHLFPFDVTGEIRYNQSRLRNSPAASFNLIKEGYTMTIIDNKSLTLYDDLQKTIHKNSKISIAAGCFSMYAYQALKKQLDHIDSLRFIFTSPTFVSEKTPKEKREFYIPRLSRERNLYGTEFEIRLRNELNQRAIARECADWIRKKVQFRSNVTQQYMPQFMTVDDTAYNSIQNFTAADLGCEKSNSAYTIITKTTDYSASRQFLEIFDQIWSDKQKMQDVTDIVAENIAAVYQENSPEFIYFYTLYNIFSEFLEDISEDVLPNEATGFRSSAIWGKLYNFQKDAALAIINKLEKYNGCILADSVGLGKTFTALAVIKYYETRNKSVLVLCPKKLENNWNTYKGNYKNNPIASDRLRYDVLFHTDLSRTHGQSNGLDLGRLNWGNYDLVVIDESHNFRNGGMLTGTSGKENRYLRLMNQVIRPGVKTKVLMLSATPVNNRFNDLKNQLALAYEGDASNINDKLKTTKPIDEIFRNAQKAFNAWSKLPEEERTTDRLLHMLDFDFFELLDSVTIARSRKHIRKYYDTADIGTFPTRLPPISKSPALTDLPDAITYDEIYQHLNALNLSVYTPSSYIMPSRRSRYPELMKNQNGGLSQIGREEGIRRLMGINLLKRLESSVASFRQTIDRIDNLISQTINAIESFKQGHHLIKVSEKTYTGELDPDDLNTGLFSVGRQVDIRLEDMDYIAWEAELKNDDRILTELSWKIRRITPKHDRKLQTLLQLIREKIRHPINPGNKKIIVFTAFADTADYLYQELSTIIKKELGLNTAEITGTVDGRSTIPDLHGDLNTVLTCFSPISKERDLLIQDNAPDLDILIATDCISEGQNLQDCDYLINYDIHWNPVRIIQRFGRIDRIGSRNQRIQLVNFWPDMDLDEYINLKARVETRMKVSVMTSTGDDDPINPEEKGDLAYRRTQLKRLQQEVVDLEDMSNGLSITDLGLNEFRLDLLDYMKHTDDVEHTPHGMHAVARSGPDTPPGIIFILKNINKSINIDHRNRIHPFYMVYIGMDGKIVCDYLHPKNLLDTLRLICRGREKPIPSLYRLFNERTRDGRDMKEISALLGDAVNSIIDIKEESDIDSLFSDGGTSALLSGISGLDDFELICFLAVL